MPAALQKIPKISPSFFHPPGERNVLRLVEYGRAGRAGANQPCTKQFGGANLPEGARERAGRIGRDSILRANFNAPMIYQADIVFERELFRDTVASVSYLLSLGRYLPTFIDRNLSLPTTTQNYSVSGGPFNGQTVTVPIFPTTRLLSSFAQLTEISSSVNSEYNALPAAAAQRFPTTVASQLRPTAVAPLPLY